MQFSEQADDAAKKVLEHYADDLTEEAMRIAARADAEGVSVPYIEQAAAHLKLRRPGSALADGLLSVGSALAGAAGGAGATIVTASGTTPTWLIAISLAGGSVGLLMTGAGLALKTRR